MHTVLSSKNITIRMTNYEWDQEVGVFMVNYYTNKTIPMGDLLCRLNNRLMFSNTFTIHDEEYLNITIHDHFARLVYSSSQAVNYSRTYEEILIYINFTIIKIVQYDSETEEEIDVVDEFALTLEGSDITIHFEGDEIGVPEIEGEPLDDYTLTWEAGENHTSGSAEILQVSGAKDYASSSQTHKNSGYMIADVSVRTPPTVIGGGEQDIWTRIAAFFEKTWVKAVLGVVGLLLVIVAIGRIKTFNKYAKKSKAELNEIKNMKLGIRPKKKKRGR